MMSQTNPTTTSPKYKPTPQPHILSTKQTSIAIDKPTSSPPPREVLTGPPPPLQMSHLRRPPNSSLLHKQHSWSPDIYRDEAWLRRKGNFKNRRSKSVTDEDLDELKACFELGFGFDSPDVDQRLSDTLPALELYYAVNKRYVDCETPSPLSSPHAIVDLGENPQAMKTRLRQWAQVVACSVKQSS